MPRGICGVRYLELQGMQHCRQDLRQLHAPLGWGRRGKRQPARRSEGGLVELVSVARWQVKGRDGNQQVTNGASSSNLEMSISTKRHRARGDIWCHFANHHHLGRICRNELRRHIELKIAVNQDFCMEREVLATSCEAILVYCWSWAKGGWGTALLNPSIRTSWRWGEGIAVCRWVRIRNQTFMTSWLAQWSAKHRNHFQDPFKEFINSYEGVQLRLAEKIYSDSSQ